VRPAVNRRTVRPLSFRISVYRKINPQASKLRRQRRAKPWLSAKTGPRAVIESQRNADGPGAKRAAPTGGQINSPHAKQFISRICH